ncbi:PASTA domain-containing protein [Candidatus Electronema sp. PJ]|uniref:PASTA domain-containing protein n=1 Tax=Candidatus Electronema sp. PJ TaxID=3401572 RepID=UPI003AA88E79
MRRPISPVRKPTVNRAVRQQNEVRRHRRLCLLLIILLLASGIWLLRRLPLSLADAGRTLQQVFNAESHRPAVPPPLAPLRGAIYDRNLEEMAVSYQLYSLQAHPAELADHQEAAEQLAAVAGADAEEILRRLLSGEQTVELAVGIDADQAKVIEALTLPGISCKPVEFRYYPGHSTAGRLLGFVSEGAGLSGAEALYDGLLQPGAFRPAEVPEIDFTGQTSLGPQAADMVLTLDIRLQKRLEEELEGWRRQTDAASGSVIVLDPDTGRLLAAVRQPGFDPNYFWQTGGQAVLPKEDGPLFPAEFFPELLQPLLTEAVAAQEAGFGGDPLPAAVSAPLPRLSQEQLETYWHEFGFDQAVPELLPLDPKHPATEDKHGRLNTADIAVDAATLLNSGKRIAPWFLKAVYDPDQQRFFSRVLDANPPKRLISPAAGVQLRQRLLHDSFWSSKEGFLFMNSVSVAVEKNGLNEWHRQDVLIVAVPQDRPRLLLALAVDYGSLYPLPPNIAPSQEQELLAELGHRLLPVLAKYAGEDNPPKQPPAAKNEANLRRFLLSRRLNQPATEEKDYEQAPQVMPDVIGLSLRQALRRLNPHKLRVQVRGTGHIVAQKPTANASLAKIDTCELTLEPLLQNDPSAPTAAKPAPRTERKSPARKSGQPDTPNHP